jgi:hypothetical protein
LLKKLSKALSSDRKIRAILFFAMIQTFGIESAVQVFMKYDSNFLKDKFPDFSQFELAACNRQTNSAEFCTVYGARLRVTIPSLADPRINAAKDLGMEPQENSLVPHDVVSKIGNFCASVAWRKFTGFCG